MENRTITIQIKLGRRELTGLLALGFLCWSVTELGSEIITFSTTYPSPVGIYARIITTGGSGATPMETVLGRNTGNVILTPATNAAGMVGIGTASPQAKLDIQGTTRFGDQTVAPDSACGPSGSSGLQRYNSTYSAMQYCDGASWKTMGGGGLSYKGTCTVSADETTASCSIPGATFMFLQEDSSRLAGGLHWGMWTIVHCQVIDQSKSSVKGEAYSLNSYQTTTCAFVGFGT